MGYRSTSTPPFFHANKSRRNSRIAHNTHSLATARSSLHFCWHTALLARGVDPLNIQNWAAISHLPLLRWPARCSRSLAAHRRLVGRQTSALLLLLLQRRLLPGPSCLLSLSFLCPRTILYERSVKLSSVLPRTPATLRTPSFSVLREHAEPAERRWGSVARHQVPFICGRGFRKSIKKSPRRIHVLAITVHLPQ